MKFKSFLLTKDHVVAMSKAMKLAGLTVNTNWSEGTVEAFFDETSVYQAIEKGRNQPWIVRHTENLFT